MNRPDEARRLLAEAMRIHGREDTAEELLAGGQGDTYETAALEAIRNALSRAAEPGVRDLLAEAAARFREYEQHHRDKAEANGASPLSVDLDHKARRNGEIADRIEAALSAPKGDEATLAAFGASDAACYHYAGADQQGERAAFCAGASWGRTPPPTDHIEIEALRSALSPLARNGLFYKPEIPHFTMIEVPLEYLRRAADAYQAVFGCEPPSVADERDTPPPTDHSGAYHPVNPDDFDPAKVRGDVTVEQVEKLLADLLFKHDPMCGDIDCRETSKRIAPEVAEWFNSHLAAQAAPGRGE